MILVLPCSLSRPTLAYPFSATHKQWEGRDLAKIASHLGHLKGTANASYLTDSNY